MTGKHVGLPKVHRNPGGALLSARTLTGMGNRIVCGGAPQLLSSNLQGFVQSQRLSNPTMTCEPLFCSGGTTNLVYFHVFCLFGLLPTVWQTNREPLFAAWFSACQPFNQAPIGSDISISYMYHDIHNKIRHQPFSMRLIWYFRSCVMSIKFIYGNVHHVWKWRDIGSICLIIVELWTNYLRPGGSQQEVGGDHNDQAAEVTQGWVHRILSKWNLILVWSVKAKYPGAYYIYWYILYHFIINFFGPMDEPCAMVRSQSCASRSKLLLKQVDGILCSFLQYIHWFMMW